MHPVSQPDKRSTFFFFNDTATTEIYTLSLHDALPILSRISHASIQTEWGLQQRKNVPPRFGSTGKRQNRSEEHTSELQSRLHLVCRLLLEKNNEKENATIHKPEYITRRSYDVLL